MRNIDDVTQSRHQGNAQSIDANKRAEFGKGYWRARVIAFATNRGDGFTLKDLCNSFGRPLNALSGRISELKRDRVLVDTGRRRDGCAVLTLAKGFQEVN